jgi:exosortase
MIAFTGIPVLQLGNMLRVPHYSVEVVQACSGIRSLLSLVAMAVAYVYFGENRWSFRIALLVSIFPIAIFTNALRVTVSCLLGYRFGAHIAEGFLHSFSGWLIFLAALASLFLFQALLHRLGSIVGRKHA